MESGTRKENHKNMKYTWSIHGDDDENTKQPHFKSLKYTNEIQSIFPLTPFDNKWKDTLKENYTMVEDECWDKGFKVWRSLPMRTELEQKLKVGGGDIRRSSDFTKTERPEAYLPGFTARKVGPISRPRASRQPTRVIAPKQVPAKQTKMATQAPANNVVVTSRRPSGGVLQDGVIRQKTDNDKL